MGLAVMEREAGMGEGPTCKGAGGQDWGRCQEVHVDGVGCDRARGRVRAGLMQGWSSGAGLSESIRTFSLPSCAPCVQDMWI